MEPMAGLQNEQGRLGHILFRPHSYHRLLLAVQLLHVLDKPRSQTFCVQVHMTFALIPTYLGTQRSVL